MPPLFVPGQILAADDLGEYNSYGPALTASTTSPNLGADGEAVGYFQRIGPRLVWFTARFNLRGTGISFGSGDWRVSLPIPVDSSAITVEDSLGAAAHIGSGWIFRSADAGSNPRRWILAVQPITTTTVKMHTGDNTSTGADQTTLRAASAIFTSATDIRLQLSGMYPCVPGA